MSPPSLLSAGGNIEYRRKCQCESVEQNQQNIASHWGKAPQAWESQPLSQEPAFQTAQRGNSYPYSTSGWEKKDNSKTCSTTNMQPHFEILSIQSFFMSIMNLWWYRNTKLGGEWGVCVCVCVSSLSSLNGNASPWSQKTGHNFLHSHAYE